MVVVFDDLVWEYRSLIQVVVCRPFYAVAQLNCLDSRLIGGVLFFGDIVSATAPALLYILHPCSRMPDTAFPLSRVKHSSNSFLFMRG